VEVEVFEAAVPGSFRTEWGIGDDETVILYHGDIGIDDGVDVLLEAAGSLPARVVIAGDGDSSFMGSLKRRAPSNVIFTGWIPYGRMPDVVASADICCAPFRSSLYTNSTFPLKPMEAMAAGKALVMSELHAFSCVVRDGFDCRLVAPGDASRLREALAELISSHGERARLGLNARATARKCFDWRIRVEREARMLLDIAGGRS
jgi:glycosyltransferase involved in cell wall biosynthesis